MIEEPGVGGENGRRPLPGRLGATHLSCVLSLVGTRRFRVRRGVASTPVFLGLFLRGGGAILDAPAPSCFGQCHLFLVAHLRGLPGELNKEMKVLGLGQRVIEGEDPCLPLMLTLSLLLLLPTG